MPVITQEFLDSALHLRSLLRQRDFECIDLDRMRIVHRIPVNQGALVIVIGQEGDASYEWIYLPERPERGQQWTHSNAGYGEPAIALRDGLNEALGDVD